MEILTENQLIKVYGGIKNNPIASITGAIGWGAFGYGYSLLLAAAGIEGGTAALLGGVVAYTAANVPALPPPPGGGAFNVYKL